MMTNNLQNMEDPTKIEETLNQYPRLTIATIPTPLHPLPRLAHQFKHPFLYMKRDDLTGLAMGGNKARKLDFIMADAQHKKASSIITWGGLQSNWCRQVAAAARMLNIKPILILFSHSSDLQTPDGNYLLDTLFKADIEVIKTSMNDKTFHLEDIKDLIQPKLEQELINGRAPYIAPLGGSLVEGSMDAPLGAIAYFSAFIETYKQCRQYNLPLDAVVLACGSGSTQAGLMVGAKLFSPQTKIIGIGVTLARQTMTEMIKKIARDLISHMNLPVTISDQDIILFDEYQLDGYGIVNQEIADIVSEVANLEGILLDPVYTGKAMLGMKDLLRRNYFNPEDRILFLHSGGNPALFHYRRELTRQQT